MILVQQKNWHKVLSEFEEKSIFTNVYQFLHLRAIAECATLQFLQCETTIRLIKEKVPHLLS